MTSLNPLDKVSVAFQHISLSLEPLSNSALAALPGREQECSLLHTLYPQVPSRQLRMQVCFY